MYRYSLLRELRKSPFIRILFAFILGIIIPNDILSIKIYSVIFFVLFGLLIFISINSYISKQYQLRTIFGVLVFILFFCLGACLDIYNEEKIYFKHQGKRIYAKAIYSGEIIKGPSFQKIKLEIIKYKYDDKWFNASFNTIAYLPKDFSFDDIPAGSNLFINTRIEEIKDNTNPYSFNYAYYLRQKYIAYSCYVSKYEIHVADSYSFSFKQIMHNIRRYVEDVYNKAEIQGDTKHILMALSIGEKQQISSMLRDRWVNAGAIHILAVSGLHVGVIYLFIVSMLNFVGKKKINKYSKTIIILLILWFYALLTGFSPSVCRATCMFSFILIGKTVVRNGYIYNSLSSSAFFMLFFDTKLISDVGFLLSYSAVFSIVFFYPRISTLLCFKSKVVTKIWQFVVLSMSAQIGTIPLILYYFNKYPTYSIFSNFIVIPLAIIFIYSSIFMILLSFSKTIIILIGLVITKIYYFSNLALKFIVELPNSTIDGIIVNEYQVFILYGILFFIVSLFILKKRNSLQWILFLSSVFLLENIRSHINISRNEIVAFNVGKNSLLTLKSGENISVIHNFNLKRSYMNNVLKPYILHSFIKNIDYHILDENIVFSCANKSILFLKNNITSIENKRIMSINTVVLSGTTTSNIVCSDFFDEGRKYILTGEFYSPNQAFVDSVVNNNINYYSSKEKSILLKY